MIEFVEESIIEMDYSIESEVQSEAKEQVPFSEKS